jgi:hypothetical protein
MADWITRGGATPEGEDVTGVNVDRASHFHTTPAFRAARPAEILEKTYGCHFPTLQPKTGRGAKRSPLHSELAQAGGVFKDVSGFGRIRTADVTFTRSKLGTQLPAGEPAASVFASGNSVIVESVDGTNGVGSLTDMVWAAIGGSSISTSTGTKKRIV